MHNLVSSEVKTADFCTIFDKAHRELVRLKWTFLRQHLRARSLDANKYSLSVRAFCVLSHAALEQCFEDVALATAINRIGDFKTTSLVNRTIITLIMYHGASETIPDGEYDVTIRTFDLLRKSVDDAHRNFSRAVNENHGISFPHLSGLLSPTGLDVQLEDSEKDAISLFKQARGEHAHTYITRVIIGPEDAVRYAFQILMLARRVAITAANLCNRPTADFRKIRLRIGV